MRGFAVLSSALAMAGASAAAPYHSTTSSHPAPSSTSSAGLPPVVQPNPRSGDMQLIQSLELAPTQRDRVNLLNQPGDFVFDFNNPPDAALTRGNGGWTVAATADTFPAVIGNGVGMTLGFIGPCGLNTPHVHNRGTEFNVIVQGRLVTNFQVENGVDARANILSRFQATVFPQGAIHTEFNPDCEDAVFVAGFNSVDPGVEQIAQTFFNLRPDIINTTLGGVAYVDGEDIDSIRAMLPANVALGVELCLNKCGKTKRAKRDLTEIFA